MKILTTFCMTALFLLACGDDVSPVWELQVSASSQEIFANGSTGVNISIGVFDSANGDVPVAQGEPVLIRCIDTGGSPTGWFAGFDTEGEADALTDAVGLVEFRYSCGGDSGSDYIVNCIALAKQTSTPLLPQIQCISTSEEEI